MTPTERCPRCDRPRATTLYGEWGCLADAPWITGGDPTCEPIDWRARALAAEARVAELETDVDDESALREKLAGLLERTANALKGEPHELMLHDWSDLPVVAAATRRDLAIIHETGWRAIVEMWSARGYLSRFQSSGPWHCSKDYSGGYRDLIFADGTKGITETSGDVGLIADQHNAEIARKEAQIAGLVEALRPAIDDNESRVDVGREGLHSNECAAAPDRPCFCWLENARAALKAAGETT